MESSISIRCGRNANELPHSGSDARSIILKGNGTTERDSKARRAGRGVNVDKRTLAKRDHKALSLPDEMSPVGVRLLISHLYHAGTVGARAETRER
jgi:hypothetical protein